MLASDLAQGSAVPEDVVRLYEDHSARAWPAPDVLRLHGWELRLTPGSRSRRVNSLNAIAPEPGRFAEVLAAARRTCAGRGLPCVARLTPLTPPEALDALAALGRPAVGQTFVMQAAIDAAPEIAGVEIGPGASQDWLEGTAASGADAQERDLIARLVGAVGMRQGFGVIRSDGAPVAVGRVAVDGAIAGVFHVATAPAARRRGFGRRLTPSLLAWAAARGATRCYLQVVADNAPAIGLYESLGFTRAYSYAYLTV